MWRGKQTAPLTNPASQRNTKMNTFKLLAVGQTVNKANPLFSYSPQFQSHWAILPCFQSVEQLAGKHLLVFSLDQRRKRNASQERFVDKAHLALSRKPKRTCAAKRREPTARHSPNPGLQVHPIAVFLNTNGGIARHKAGATSRTLEIRSRHSAFTRVGHFQYAGELAHSFALISPTDLTGIGGHAMGIRTTKVVISCNRSVFHLTQLPLPLRQFQRLVIRRWQ